MTLPPLPSPAGAPLSVVLFHFSLFGAAAPTYGATGADAAFAFLPGAVSAGWIGVQFFDQIWGFSWLTLILQILVATILVAVVAALFRKSSA